MFMLEGTYFLIHLSLLLGGHIVYVGMCVHIWNQGTGEHSEDNHASYQVPSTFWFEKRSLLSLGLYQVGWIGQCMPGILLSLPPKWWGYSCVPPTQIFMWVPGTELKSSHLHYKHVINWAISPVLFMISLYWKYSKPFLLAGFHGVHL